MKDGGLCVPRTKSSLPLHTNPEGQRLADEAQLLQGSNTSSTSVVHSRSSLQGSTPCSHTLKS